VGPLRDSSTVAAAASSAGGGGGGGPVSGLVGAGGTVEQQIAATLLRLQHDMSVVLVRLHSIETLTQQQASSNVKGRL